MEVGGEVADKGFGQDRHCSIDVCALLFLLLLVLFLLVYNY